MLAHDVVLAIASKIIDMSNSPYFFTNQKTIASVDFGVCSLMKKGRDGKYKSKVCKGCYSTILLNLWSGLRAKVENLPTPDDEQLQAFEETLAALRTYVPGMKRLRFYSFSDFDPAHMPYIRLAAKYFEVDIISKALCFPQNEDSLRELISEPNVFLSLSFNKDFMKFFNRVKDIVKDADNAHLNYTLNYNEENPDELPFRQFISVWHLKNDRKRFVLDEGRFETLKETNVCGVFDPDGNRNTYVKENRGNGERVHEKKGSCHSCNNCRQTLKSTLCGSPGLLPEKIAV